MIHGLQRELSSPVEYIQGVPVGVVPKAPLATSVLIAIMGPRPWHYGDGRTTLDDIQEMALTHGNAVTVFIPGMFTPQEEASTGIIRGIRLRGMTAMRNWAVEQALDKGYSYLLLIENDVQCTPGLLNDLLMANKPIIIPNLHFPTFPLADLINYAPRPSPDQHGLIELIWACHSIILFRRDALEDMSKVFMGFTTEGADHLHWQSQKYPAWMDLDTMVNILEVPMGEKSLITDVPFETHTRNGISCPGPMYEVRRCKGVGLYQCSVSTCDFELCFYAPDKTNHKVSGVIPHDMQLESSYRQEHWAMRSKHYQDLEWVNRKDYLNRIIDSVSYETDEVVLDAGCGAGAIAHALAFKVGKVVGLDISPAMIKLAEEKSVASEEFFNGDIRRIPFPQGFFSKVFSRMVFHSLTGHVDIHKAAGECYRVLQEGGTFILSEGVPPEPSTYTWYKEMFKLKEDRLTLSQEIMEELLRGAGFKEVESIIHVTPQCSIQNWLNNSGLPKSIQNKIYQMHRNMDENIRRAYNATFTNDDVLCDFKFVIVKGVK